MSGATVVRYGSITKAGKVSTGTSKSKTVVVMKRKPSVATVTHGAIYNEIKFDIEFFVRTISSCIGYCSS